MPTYQEIATEARSKVLDLIYKAQTSHIGSNFSCIDILAVLFEKIDLKKDEFVLSKGWVAASLYYFLWRKGRITQEQLDSFCQEGSEFIGLAEPIIPEIKIAGGSMGLGLPGAVGIAMAKKIKGEEGKVYVLMSDGEMQIGTFWESMLIARQHNLDNLVILVDYNGLQAMGSTEEILSLSGERMELIDGHEYHAIHGALETHCGHDVAVFKTIKGKGVSFMEGNNLYHYKGLSEEEYQKAKEEIHG